MAHKRLITMATRSCAAGAALAVGSYAAYVAVTWLRYGHVANPGSGQADPLLDRFMPVYEIVERHQTHVSAPADVTLSAAYDMALDDSRIIRAIFKTREILLGATPDTTPRPRGMLALTKSLGWGVLAESPGRELVMGAVTQPWQADVVFRSLPPQDFAAFQEPGYVKIVWNLRADPLANGQSIFRTETRAVATSPDARAKFRNYWSRLSPGIILIRRATLGPLRREAERRAQVVLESDRRDEQRRREAQ
jgi:hypothetical protein